MTRYQNFMAIAHAYYDAYVSQAACLGKKPLSYNDWLATDKSKAPGFANDECQKNCRQQCRDANGRFMKYGIGDLKKVADQVEKERGPAASVKPLEAEKPEFEEKFFVFKNGKVIEGEEAKKYLIENGLIDNDDEDDDEEPEKSDKDDGDDDNNDYDYKFAMKDADNFFKSVFGRHINEFM